jgi:hypothetical protein
LTRSEYPSVAQLFITQVADPDVFAADASKVLIVGNDHLGILCEMNVQLDCIPDIDRSTKCCQGVLWIVLVVVKQTSVGYVRPCEDIE